MSQKHFSYLPCSPFRVMCQLSTPHVICSEGWLMHPFTCFLINAIKLLFSFCGNISIVQFILKLDSGYKLQAAQVLIMPMQIYNSIFCLVKVHNLSDLNVLKCFSQFIWLLDYSPKQERKWILEYVFAPTLSSLPYNLLVLEEDKLSIVFLRKLPL